MSVEKASKCVDCGRPCIKGACPYFKQTVFVCDECGEETNILYKDMNGQQFCEECALAQVKKIEF